MISIIVALAKNNVIGKNNSLPWYYPEDLKYFKETTLNHTVLMGRKTFDSIINRINKPLPNRKNLVVTSLKELPWNDVQVVNDLNEFLRIDHQEEIFVIGGKQIYEQTLSYADRLYITFINKDHDGDIYFPEIDYSKYKLISKKDLNELSFCIFERM